MPSDDDLNGTLNTKCARCRAEESWNFDEYPNAKFSRDGRLNCDCANPPPSRDAEGVFHVSEDCPVHGPIQGFAHAAGTDSVIDWSSHGGVSEIKKRDDIRQSTPRRPYVP